MKGCLENPPHTFTDVDYVNYYKGLIEEGDLVQAEIIFANNLYKIVDYADSVICADIPHKSKNEERLIKKKADCENCSRSGRYDLLNAPVDGSGYNPDYGILSSNRLQEGTIKLFPIFCKSS